MIGTVYSIGECVSSVEWSCEGTRERRRISVRQISGAADKISRQMFVVLKRAHNAGLMVVLAALGLRCLRCCAGAAVNK